ncbi:MAG: prephenate/arogenate dehydrogenase family protein [Alphaproteobacteria bacterium]|jgi:cyclohexadieny/prephenate dehydrogenase|nr:prephenate/arogenate dehydrogenase family protein [Alphaproteobacteria bacterium]MBT4083432.1 prephenate/arogenate dehydrogenase family protein [Alphaproteobacteria bacterium]MBT4542916.1 prephenate/arogenate dehydrogenase family protein [Alphaproteobacteria bacterium]MBT5920298.1 prephenate/arogenate dehydrogenase family protein [Alphaproteobacteria bacterium]MBT6384655.1 prephenate/arogenate dehydrogenase family protein [Alphaproteobacteria bacterium]
MSIPDLTEESEFASGALYKRVALLGVGLINGSLAWGILRHGLADEVVGYSRSQGSVDRALELGFISEGSTDAAEIVKDADLVVIGTPVGASGEMAALIAANLKPGSTLTDVGSVKSAVVRDVGPHVPEGVHFIPGHPVAGTENSGPDAGFAELFEDHWCILTPPPGTDQTAVDRLAALWQRLNSKVEFMDAKHHDLVLAVTSHLPHLIAYNIVGTANDMEEVTRSEVIKYAGGGFHDFTRIAASDPTMWRDVFLNNKEAVLEMLGRFSEDLTALQRAIRWGDGDILFDLFTRTRKIRREVVAAGQAEVPKPPED